MKKGTLGMTIFIGIVVVVQIAIMVMGFLFMKQIQEAKDFQKEQQAAADANWDIDMLQFEENAKTISKNYAVVAGQTIRSYWHSEDHEFRLSINSDALKTLMSQRFLVIKESKSDDHLSLTVYYNPLRLKDPKNEDLMTVYQIIRYQKPEIAKLYDQKLEALALEDDSSEETLDESTTSSVELDDEVTEVSETSIYHYPFESDQILVETEEYVIFENAEARLTSLSLNYEFISPYFKEGSMIGDYGWEKGFFYWDPEVVEESATEDLSDESINEEVEKDSVQ